MLVTSTLRARLALLLLPLTACGIDQAASRAAEGEALIASLAIPAPDTLAAVEGLPIAGGFGSGAALDPGDSTRIYVITDRGPNYDAGPAVKAFPVPGFTPRVGVLRLVDRTSPPRLELERTIPLQAYGGKPESGLPNPPGPGATGETAVTPAGDRLALDPLGLDPEGIHVLRDGSFWISDEYGPYLVHFDATGRTLERLSPFAGERRLPAVLARRRVNRGLEGLTGDPDGATLVAILQAPLDNPPGGGAASRLTRVLVYEPATGRSRQYLYPLDAPGSSASGLAWIDAETLLVLEHDGEYPGGTPPARIKRIYRASLAGATEVGDPVQAEEGRRVRGRTLEASTIEDLQAEGIAVAAKTLVVDLLALGYPHDKPEGLVLLGGSRIGVVNDDDFGITDGAGGLPVAKLLPARPGRVDWNELWIVRPAAVRPRATPPGRAR